jgi:uncharacterized protein YeaO (DUF488 family)
VIRIKRVYDPPSPEDGIRVLVDRLWPRGLSKRAARFDRWEREVAPSTELRRWYGHDPARYAEFRRRYLAELKGRPELLQRLREDARRGPLTLLFAAREGERSNAAVLKECLEATKKD